MRTHNTPRLCAGPQTAGTPIKFWNVASTGDDEGEITLYGDVVSRQPVDWWTGEPEPGLYIAPESFMEDLAAVKGKNNITIKINSCGGDLYTGIAIHNAIKGLTGHKVVVVEAGGFEIAFFCSPRDQPGNFNRTDPVEHRPAERVRHRVADAPEWHRTQRHTGFVVFHFHFLRVGFLIVLPISI